VQQYFEVASKFSASKPRERGIMSSSLSQLKGQRDGALGLLSLDGLFGPRAKGKRAIIEDLSDT
jgi:hypothetical protein